MNLREKNARCALVKGIVLPIKFESIGQNVGDNDQICDLQRNKSGEILVEFYSDYQNW